MPPPHKGRSGLLTREKLERVIRWVEKLPNDLPKVARACLIYPADLLYWFALGQTYDCPVPLAAELAWRVNEIRARKAAKNQKRIEAGANGGKKTKIVTEPDPVVPELSKVVSITVEDVLPQQWAIERLEKQAAESRWELSPNDDIAEDLVHAFESSKETPLLTSGEVSEQPAADSPSDGDSAALHPGPESAPDLPGGEAPRED